MANVEIYQLDHAAAIVDTARIPWQRKTGPGDDDWSTEYVEAGELIPPDGGTSPVRFFDDADPYSFVPEAEDLLYIGQTNYRMYWSYGTEAGNLQILPNLISQFSNEGNIQVEGTSENDVFKFVLTIDELYLLLKDIITGSVVFDDEAKTVDIAESGVGSGDMLKSVYDVDDDGIVDLASFANAISSGGEAGASKYYGTDEAFSLGFHDLPGSGVISGEGLLSQGNWNASTNTPDLTLTENKVIGHLYLVNVAGNTDLNGITSWSVGDNLYFDDTEVWVKIDNTDAVRSFNKRKGIVKPK
ncbi:MAG: hypothetical protein WCD18_08050, partial [Thermosynechococcaceae cyanobacterium]